MGWCHSETQRGWCQILIRAAVLLLQQPAFHTLCTHDMFSRIFHIKSICCCRYSNIYQLAIHIFFIWSWDLCRNIYFFYSCILWLSSNILHHASSEPVFTTPSHLQGCSQSVPILWSCLVLLLIFLLPESPQKICLILFSLVLSFCFSSLASISFLSPSGDLISRMCVMFCIPCAYTGRGVAGEDKATKGHTLRHSHAYVVLVFPLSAVFISHFRHFGDIWNIVWAETVSKAEAKTVFTTLPLI